MLGNIIGRFLLANAKAS